MGDGLKLTKDKRHRSSSSLAGVVLDGTRSERKLDVNMSIPEVDDQFAIAEARCDDLQEKIDLIKSLKRKKRLKKRSMTKVMEPIPPDNVPFITVRTQPKKKVSQQAARMRRLEVPPNPTRGYLDPATIEQHRMIGQVRGYNNAFKQPHQERIGSSKAPANYPPPNADHVKLPYTKMRVMRQQRSQADGDRSSSLADVGHGVQICSEAPADVACGQDDVHNEYSNYSNYEEFDRPTDMKPESRHQVKQASGRRRHVPKDITKEDSGDPWRNTAMSPKAVRGSSNKVHRTSSGVAASQAEERPVVELFNKSYASPDIQQIPEPPPQVEAQPPRKARKARNNNKMDDDVSRLENIANGEQHKANRYPRRVKYRNRRYELPTVASQMKQTGMRYYYDTSNHTNIPFVVSKSTAPSHNIGVNIQQVLNGLKIQQPLSGIPLTMAHHMGLGHLPTYSTKSAAMVPALDHREINVIKVGRRLLRLPSYKYVSYNRLLNLYREGDGMVPRFLRAISRPHYFYTSMYNLATNHDDFDGATSKGRACSQEAKQNLTEFAKLYREFENINKCIKEGNYDSELEQRRDDLSKELAMREQHIRRVVQDYRSTMDNDQNLRASASTAEEGYRHSTFKLGGESQQ